MPDLLAVRTVGADGSVCLAAVGSHTSGQHTKGPLKSLTLAYPRGRNLRA